MTARQFTQNSCGAKNKSRNTSYWIRSSVFSLVLDWLLEKELEKTKPQVLICGSPGCSQWILNSLRANFAVPKIKIAVGCEHRWSAAICGLNTILFDKLAQTGGNVKHFFAKFMETALLFNLARLSFFWLCLLLDRHRDKTISPYMDGQPAPMACLCVRLDT